MLALVSFTSTVYPSLIGTRPPSLLFLSKHSDAHAQTHTHTHAYTRAFGCTHAVRHVRTHAGELWEHLEELIQCTDKRFLESTKRTIRGASNGPPPLTQTHTLTHTHTHLLAAEVKGQIRWVEGTKSTSLRLKVLQHLWLTLRAQGLAFFPAGVSHLHILIYIHTLYATLPGSRARQDTETAKLYGELFFSFTKQFQYVRVRLSGLGQAPTTPRVKQGGKINTPHVCVCGNAVVLRSGLELKKSFWRSQRKSGETYFNWYIERRVSPKTRCLHKKYKKSNNTLTAIKLVTSGQLHPY